MNRLSSRLNTLFIHQLGVLMVQALVTNGCSTYSGTSGIFRRRITELCLLESSSADEPASGEELVELTPEQLVQSIRTLVQ
jgi:hypothetical protein